MDESIVVKPGDSNEVETAKRLLQAEYYLRSQPTNWMLDLVETIKAGAITADQVLNMREL